MGTQTLHKSNSPDTELADQLLEKTMSITALLSMALDKLPNSTDEDDSRALILGARSLGFEINETLLSRIPSPPAA